MKRYQFNQSVKVDGVLRLAGVILLASEIPAGNLESMLRLGQVSEFNEATQFVAAMSVAPVSLAEDLQAAAVRIAELEKLLAQERSTNEAAAAEAVTLRTRIAELESASKTPDEKPNTDEKKAEPAAEPEKAPPKIGPSKPPELKTGKK